jgi:hypothetical protein
MRVKYETFLPSLAGTGGSQTDLYLYVTSDDSSCESSVAAYALPCLYDYFTSRPVVSVVNLCAEALNTYTSDKLLSTTIHEIIHSLVRKKLRYTKLFKLAYSQTIVFISEQGFTSALFGFFIDSSGNTLDLSSVILDVPPTIAPSARGNYSMIITPTVVQQVRFPLQIPVCCVDRL